MNETKKKTFFVVGSNGLVGQNLVRQLIEQGHNVIAYSYNAPAEPVEGCIYYRGDVNEYGTLDRIYKAHPIDCVIHNAAISSPSLYTDNPYKIYHVNVEGLLTSVEAACQNGVKRFVYISSDSVYGYEMRTVTEDSPVRPVETYGCSKVACEYLLSQYADMQTACLRVGTVYGPHRVINCPVNRLIRQALGSERIPWYCAGDTQDFIYETDVADGIIAVCTADRWEHRVYNLGSYSRTSLRDTVGILKKLFPDREFVEDEAYLRDDFSGVELCNDRICEEFNWSPKVSFEEGVRRCAEGLKESQKQQA